MPPKIAGVAGLEENLRQQDRVARALKERRHAMGALTLTTIEARPVFEDDTLRDLAESEHNRATELIEDFMIASTSDRSVSRGPRLLVDSARRPRAAEVGTQSSTSRPRIISACRRSPTRWRSRSGCLRERASEPQQFADLSLSVVKAPWTRRIRESNALAANKHGAFRARRAGLRAFDGAETEVPRIWWRSGSSKRR
jgi:exoribonuclease-2